MHARRLLATTVLGTALVAAPLSAAAAPDTGRSDPDRPPSSRPRAAAPILQDPAPTPPADAMGTPGGSTVARADNLLWSASSGGAAPSVTWTQWSSDLSNAQHSGSSDQPLAGRTVLNPLYPTAAGRFADPYRDRTLAFQLVGAGADALWQLSSTDDAAENYQSDVEGARIVDGGTYAFAAGTGVLTAAISDTEPMQPVTGVKYDDRRAQQWTLLSRGDDLFWVVNRADGLCLRVLDDLDHAGSAVGTYPCNVNGVNVPAELWKVTAAAGGTVFVNQGSSMALQQQSDGSVVQQPVVAGSAAQTWSNLGIKQPLHAPGTGLTGPLSTWSVPAWGRNLAAPFALAAGDLDRSVSDADGQYHDEAVVAYTDENRALQLRVIDYNATPGRLLATGRYTTLPVTVPGLTDGGVWYPGSVGVAVGDYDGDGVNEVALTWQDAGRAFHATLLRYAASGGDRTLQVLGDVKLFSSAPSLVPSVVSGLAQTVSGDLIDAGRDGLAIAFDAVVPGASAQPYVGTVDLDANLRLHAEATHQVTLPDTGGSDGLPAAYPGPNYTWHGLRLAPGLFTLSPDGSDLHRRQLALAWSEVVTLSPGAPAITASYAQILGVDPAPIGCSSACRQTISSVTDVQLLTALPGSPTEVDHRPISIAAGGFGGVDSSGGVATWGLAVGVTGHTDRASGNGGHVVLLRVQGNQLAITSVGGTGADGLHYTVTAYDRDGASLILGAPVVFDVESLDQASVIAAQPPAHADWFPGATDFTNVSRTGDFTVDLGSTSTSTLEHTESTTHANTLGFSESAESKTTVEGGLFGVGKLGGSLKLAAKFGQEAAHENTSLDKYTRVTTSQTSQIGTDDDIVDGLYKSSRIYRYPILGGPLTTTDGQPVTSCAAGASTCYGYWEVSIPGTTVKVQHLGKQLDWYQPTWQNGNALSYPALVNNQVPIPNPGTFTYTDQNGAKVTSDDALFNLTTDIGGGKTTDRLEVDDAYSHSDDVTTGKTYSYGGEVQVGVKAKFNVGVAKGENKTSVTLGVDATTAESNLTTSVQTTENAKEFALDVPNIPTSQGYRVGTAYYYGVDGAQRVVHGVDLRSSAGGGSWWNQRYGLKADPALNQPYAVDLDFDAYAVLRDPKWSSLPTAQTIRGFAALQPQDPAAPATTGLPYPDNPRPGDPVVFSVPVHNYSLKAADSVPVRFYAVPVDANNLAPTGAPVPIGPAQTISHIDPQGLVTVQSVPWSAVGPTDGSAVQQWRIVVVLDPDGTLDEIHPLRGGAACPAEKTMEGEPLVDPVTGEESTLACGQNNQGYGLVSVSAGGLQGARTTATVELAGSRIIGGPPGGPAVPVVTVGRPVRIGVQANADANDPSIRRILVFDGDPANGRVVGGTTLSGVGAEGGDATFTWTPTKPGWHVLHQVLLGRTLAGERNVTTFTVDVAPRPGPDWQISDLPALVTGLPTTDAVRARLARRADAAVASEASGHPRRTLRQLRAMQRILRAERGRAVDARTADGFSAILERLARSVRHGTFQITAVQYNAPGRDKRTNASINGEQVRITNVSGRSQSLTGWILSGRRVSYIFPATRVPPGRTIVVRSGRGQDTASRRYVGSRRHLWGNRSGTALLRSDLGVEDRYRWSGTV